MKGTIRDDVRLLVVSIEHKTRTRDRIVRNAARKLRAEGLRGPGVASVMKASGLTVGGFYEHFRSKDELLAEAIAEGFSESSEKISSSLLAVVCSRIPSN